MVPGRWGQRALRPWARNEQFAVPVYLLHFPPQRDRLRVPYYVTLLAGRCHPPRSAANVARALPLRRASLLPFIMIFAVCLRATITFQTVFLPLVSFRFLSFVPLRLPYQSVYKPLSFPCHTCREGYTD